MRKYVLFFSVILLVFAVLKENKKSNSPIKISEIKPNVVKNSSTIVSEVPKKEESESQNYVETQNEDKNYADFMRGEVEYAKRDLDRSQLVFCHASEVEIFQELSQRENPIPVPITSDEKLSICKKLESINTDGYCLTRKTNCPFNYSVAQEEELVYFMEAEEVVHYLKKIEDLEAYILDPLDPRHIDEIYWDNRLQELSSFQNKILEK